MIDRLDPRAFDDRAPNERTRGQSEVIRETLSTRNQGKKSLRQRVVQDWNSLSEHDVAA